MKKFKIWAFIVFIIALIILLGFLSFKLYEKCVSSIPKQQTIVKSLDNENKEIASKDIPKDTSKAQIDTQGGNPIEVANNLFKNYFNNIAENCSGGEKVNKIYIYDTKIFNVSKDSFMAKVYYEADITRDIGSSKNQIITQSIFKLEATKKPHSNKYVMTSHGKDLEKVKALNVELEKGQTLEENSNVAILPFLFKYNVTTDTLSLTNNEGETWEELPIKLENIVSNYILGNTINNLQELASDVFTYSSKGIGFMYPKGKNVMFLYKKTGGNSNWIQKDLPFEEDNMILMGNIYDDGQGYIIGTSSVANGFSESMAYITSDYGENWKRINIPNGKSYGILTAGAIVNSKNAVVGYSQAGSGGVNLQITKDGGASWKNINIPGNSYLNPVKIQMNKNGTGELTVEDGSGVKTLYSTTDFGETWKAKNR